jgi:hypothetical protein
MEDSKLARDYAESIGAEILALENVLTGVEFNCVECGESWSFCRGLYGPDSENDDLSMIHEFEPSEAAEFELLNDMASEAGDSADDYTPSIVDYLNSHCLEFFATGEKRGGGWMSTGTKSLRSYGGPNCWIKTGDDSFVTVSVYWGGGHAINRVLAAVVVESLNELAVE